MADDASTAPEALPLDPDTSRSRPGPRRRALWGALAVVAVVAGALAIGRSGSGEGPPALPVALGSASFETAGGAAADTMLAWMRYEAGNGLPALGGEGEALRVRPSVTAESVRELAAALGLEVEAAEDGAVWRVASPDGTLEVDAATGMWWYAEGVTDPDSPASSSASDQAVASCDAGDPACTATTHPPELSCTAVGCPEPGGSGAPPIEQCIAIYPEPPECIEPATVPEPVEPGPAPDLPSEQEARRLALDVVAAGGMDVEGAVVQVDGPHDAWYVFVEPVVGTTPVTGLTAIVSVGPDGAILSASGTMATTEAVGTSPLVDTRTAIDRLNAMSDVAPGVPGSAGDAAGPAEATSPSAVVTTIVAVPCDDVPEDQLSVVGPCPSVTTCAAEPGTGAGECIDPAVPTTLAPELPTEPSPEPPPGPSGPLVVTLTEAERTLMVLPANDGSSDSYLVPGYRLRSADGHQVEVVAVADESLAPAVEPETTLPAEPPATEPGVAEPPATEPASEPGVAEPVPPSGRSDCEVFVEEDGSGTTHTMQTCPGQIPSSDVEVVDPVEGEPPSPSSDPEGAQDEGRR